MALVKGSFLLSLYLSFHYSFNFSQFLESLQTPTFEVNLIPTLLIRSARSQALAQHHNNACAQTWPLTGSKLMFPLSFHSVFFF
jgi:hypothetical protein